MPEWLIKKDNYKPHKDKDAFINKSILSILQVLTKFRLQNKSRGSTHAINSLLKLITTFVFIVFLSLSKSLSFVLICNIFLLVIINFLSIDEIKYIVKVSFTVTMFTLIILLPSILWGYDNNALLILLKVFASVTMVNTLASTTQWNELTRALKKIHVPDMFIFVLDITVKYIILLGDFSLNMVYALKLRSVGKSNNKSAALSGVVGTMFLKSKEMAEEMYAAMECRGFTGQYKVYNKFKLRLADYICILFNVVFIVTYFYFDRL